MKTTSSISGWVALATRFTAVAGIAVSSTAAMAAGPWQLLGSANSAMEVIESFTTQAECAKAMTAALTRQSQRDFMCVDSSKAPATVKK